jgi:hypothetical protein
MKYNHMNKLALALAFGLPSLAVAGPETESMPPAEKPNNVDICEWLQNKPGILYKDKSNPYIQEFQLEGRIQWQTASVDGDTISSGDYSDTYTEWRRARLGAKVKFLQYFGLKYQVNLVDDLRPETSGDGVDWSYQDIDEAYLSFNLAKAAGLSNFEKLDVLYGRQKFVIGGEAGTSSTKLLTIERSAIANKIYGSYRPTGLTVVGETGKFDFATSVYSSSADGDGGFGAEGPEFHSWNDSYAFLGNLGYALNDQTRLYVDFTYNFAETDGSEDSLIEYEWATAFGAQYDAGPYGINVDFILGDNGDAGGNTSRSGSFWGAVFTPYYWLMEDKLQAVAQYQYAGSSEENGVRINSRYGRREGSFDINSGRGDSHHSLYGGLNYYICGHNAKVQAGVEYQTMDTPSGDFNTLTYILGLRAYF